MYDLQASYLKQTEILRKAEVQKTSGAAVCVSFDLSLKLKQM